MPAAAPFHRAFALLVRRRGETFGGLTRALAAGGVRIDRMTLAHWASGAKTPGHAASFAALGGLERRWGLPPGYFRKLLPPSARAPRGAFASLGRAEKARLAWHLPEDFDGRPVAEQAEILDWVRRVIVSGATGYRRYHGAMVREPFALRFPSQQDGRRTRRGAMIVASPRLDAELADLIAFKTAPLAPPGLRRRSVWNAATARQKAEHLGLVFGALAAAADGPVKGLGAPREALCLALLAMPAAWDGYLGWRLRRRGFFTAWEEDLMKVTAALAHPETGWFVQRPGLADGLVAIEGLVTEAEVAAARADWPGHCTRLRAFAHHRMREIRAQARVHNDPFEPILPVLEADRPAAVYARIAEEVLRRRPDPVRYPKAAAENARAYLMVRLGLHLGFRQRNLRELLVCPKGRPHRAEQELAQLRRGELRWNVRRNAWEVFAPAAAFKNAHSRFFSGGPFLLELPDLAGLRQELETYLAVHRPRLLGGAPDPGVFFVKTASAATTDASYDGARFYEAWRDIIRRHGIYNPWTGRGAVAGLLPHGPHSVRDVLATHVLKQTGSFEQASYAIQDTPETLIAHYGRFLPQHRAAIAAGVLNAVWEDPAPDPCRS